MLRCYILICSAVVLRLVSGAAELVGVANPERAFGGHLEPGTNVFTFVAVTLGVLADGVDISRVDDKTYR